jgi:DNA replication protein DnaC
MAEPADPSACPDCAGSGYVVEQALGQSARARRCTCQSTCARCGGSGYLLVPSGSSSVAQPCACRHLDERIALFNQIGIPPVIARASFQYPRTWHPGQVHAKNVAEAYAHKFRLDQPTRGFLLYGRPGGGKTHLLVSTLRYLALERGVASRYAEFLLVLSDMKAGFNANRSHMEILKPLLSVPVLAIDELGKERGTEWERSMLDELISRRFNSGLSTIFATNYFLTASEYPVREEPGRRVTTRSPEFAREAEAMTLAQRVGDRIFSRLTEMCELVKLDPGNDFRGLQPNSGPRGGAYWS